MNGRPVLTLTVDIDRVERLYPEGTVEATAHSIDFAPRSGDRVVAYVVVEHDDGTTDAPVVVVNGASDYDVPSGLRIVALRS